MEVVALGYTDRLQGLFERNFTTPDIPCELGERFVVADGQADA